MIHGSDAFTCFCGMKRGVCRRVVVKNQYAISPQLSSLAPHGINTRFQHLHVKYLINSRPFGYRITLDDTPDVQKADHHRIHLGF
jgi:hypothetical protein